MHFHRSAAVNGGHAKRCMDFEMTVMKYDIYPEENGERRNSRQSPFSSKSANTAHNASLWIASSFGLVHGVEAKSFS